MSAPSPSGPSGAPATYAGAGVDIDAGEALAHVWRPIAAAAAMATVLWFSGLGWTHADAPWVALLSGVALGAVSFAVSLALLWATAGFPAGAEADAWATLRRVVSRR